MNLSAAKRLTLAVASMLVATATFGVPAASAAQSVAASTTPSAPIDGTPTTITVTGSSDTGGSVYASLESPDAGCGSNPSNDSGNQVISGDSVSGPAYSDTQTITPAEGSYVLCTWLMPAGDDGSGVPLAGPSATPLTVQPLQATITLTAPVSVSYQQPIPVSVKWQANSAGSLLVDILPASDGPCTADPANEPQYAGWLSGQDGYTNNDPIGQDAASGTTQYLAGEFGAGTYRLCAWAEEPSGNVVAGPASLDVQMVALPGSRTYSGHTTQHLPLAVTASGYNIQDIIYSARFTCETPAYFSTGLRWNGIWNNTVLTAANFGTIKLTDGRFAANLDANPSNRFNLRGTVTGDTLSGTLNAVMRIGPPQFKHAATCRTGNVHFAIAIQTPKRRNRRRHRSA